MAGEYPEPAMMRGHVVMRQESSEQWHFLSSPSAEALEQLDSSSKGLSGDEARRRHLRDAHLFLKPKSRLSTYELLFRQFTSPIIILLLAAAGLAFFLADPTDTAIIRRSAGRAEDVRQHIEVCLYGDQRELRQYVQHGRGVAISALSPPAAQANIIDQSPDRRSGNDHRRR